MKDFLVVINCGIYYHLKDPLLSFTRPRQVMKEGAILIVAGVVIDFPEHFAEDPTNWWVPSVPCLRQWVECSFFEVLTQHQTHPTVCSVCSLTARAIKRKDPHYFVPDTELAEFDLNVYHGYRKARLRTRPFSLCACLHTPSGLAQSAPPGTTLRSLPGNANMSPRPYAFRQR